MISFKKLLNNQVNLISVFLRGNQRMIHRFNAREPVNKEPDEIWTK